MKIYNKFKRLSAVALAFAALCTTVACSDDSDPKSGNTPLEVEADSATFISDVRLLSWNVQDGMWADQYNNYDAFVEYVKGIDPDIFCIQEGATHFDTNTKTIGKYSSNSLRYLPNKYAEGCEAAGWKELAARWNHPYVIMGPYQDNYPVIITSKYPIRIVERLGKDAGFTVSHGAVHAQIKFSDTYTLNLVNLHLYPHEATYRENEIQQYLAATINSEKYYNQSNWLMMGDFNSSVNTAVDKQIKKNSYYDLWAEMNNIDTGHIDFVYGTKTMLQSLKSAKFLYGFAHQYKQMTSDSGATLNSGSGMWIYSDHYPVLMEFSLYEQK